MRKYFLVMNILLMALPLSANAAELIYVGGSGGSTERVFKEKIIPTFEANTGAKVVYVSGNSTDILARLQAQKREAGANRGTDRRRSDVSSGRSGALRQSRRQQLNEGVVLILPPKTVLHS